ncbi:MAG: YdeI/OmpD-associated family protein, partial [Methylocella sp.]
KLAKKGTGIASVSKSEAIDTALCYGWIDGQLDKFDECYWLVRFTARKPGSKWSQINRDRATALIAQSRIRPAGMFEIERAKADGRWDAAYAPQSTATVPNDLRIALGLAPDALRMFDRLDSANRYAILHRLHNAKGAKTRRRGSKNSSRCWFGARPFIR